MSTAPKRPGIKSLNTSADCRRLLSKAIKLYNSDEIPEAKLRTLAYSLTALQKLIEADAYEDRLAEIERQLEALEKHD